MGFSPFFCIFIIGGAIPAIKNKPQGTNSGDRLLDSIKFTVDEVRSFKGYENLTEQEANQMIDFLSLYAMIVYNAMKDDGTVDG